MLFGNKMFYDFFGHIGLYFICLISENQNSKEKNLNKLNFIYDFVILIIFLFFFILMLIKFFLLVM